MGHFMMVAVGSSGDVNPFLGIAEALASRGHQATLLSAPRFAGAAAAVGAAFVPLGTAEAYDAIYDDPDLWHPRRGLRIYFSYLATLVEQTVEVIEQRHDPGNTAVLAPFQCFGARVAQEALGVPLCTVLPYPISLQSAYDPNRNPVGNPPRWMGPSAVRLMYRLINWEVARHSRRGVERARKARGLSNGIKDLVSWSYSPQAVVGLWPSLFSSPQPDWPPQARNTGFISYDGPAAAGWDPPGGLPDRDDWLVFTPGTQMTHGRAFFRAACDASARLGHPTLMVASDRSALPDELPSGVHHLAYAPFAWLFARAGAVVHHGGVGTAGRALQAGLPQLIIPRGFDQFDNAQRVVRLGAGLSMDRDKVDATSLTSSIRRLLTDGTMRQRCGEIRSELAATDADELTCRVVEGLIGGPRQSPGPAS